MKTTKRIPVPKNLDQPRMVRHCRERINGRIVYLSVFLTELQIQEENRYTDSISSRRTKECLHELLGGPEEWGILQREMDAESGGILTRLKREMPELSAKELLLFSYVHAGFTNKVMCRLLELRDQQAVSLMHCRLRDKIERLETPSRAEYLDFLPQRACRIGQEMLYLHNL